MKHHYYTQSHDHQIVAMAFLTRDMLAPEGAEQYYLNRISVPFYNERGKGFGTSLLKQICDDADKEGVTLLLGVSPDEPGYFRRLVKWYARHGFMPPKGQRRISQVRNLMIRRPIA